MSEAVVSERSKIDSLMFCSDNAVSHGGAKRREFKGVKKVELHIKIIGREIDSADKKRHTII